MCSVCVLARESPRISTHRHKGTLNCSKSYISVMILISLSVYEMENMEQKLCSCFQMIQITTKSLRSCLSFCYWQNSFDYQV